jgi:Flp pilus assembly protein TadD
LRTFAVITLIAVPVAGCLPMAGPFSSNEAASAQLAAFNDFGGETNLQKGKRHFRDQNFGLAEQSFRAAVEADPSNAEAWLGLGASYDELRRFDLADRAYARVLKLTGPTAELLNNRGYSMLLRGDFKAARQSLYAARAKDPSNPQVNHNIALLTAR